METKIILDRYAKYYEYLQKLGEFNLDVRVTIEDLQLPKGLIQSAYKEMEKSFQGGLVYYLCFISTLYLVDLAKKNSLTDLERANLICNNYSVYQPDTVNLLRLFHLNPNILLDMTVDSLNYKDTTLFLIDRYKAFMLFSSVWYMARSQGYSQNHIDFLKLIDIDSDDIFGLDNRHLYLELKQKYLQLINQLISG